MEEISNAKTKRIVKARIERLVNLDNQKEINDLLITLYRNLTLSNAEELDGILDELQTLIRSLRNLPEESMGEILDGITEDNIALCQDRIDVCLRKQTKYASVHKTKARDATDFVVVVLAVGFVLFLLFTIVALVQSEYRK